MAKLVTVGVQVPDTYPENSPVEVVYPVAYYAQARAAGGMVEGKLGAASGGFRPLLSKSGGPLLVYGGELGDPLPPLVQIRVKPRGAGHKGVDWHIEGHPRDTGGGAWDGSGYGQPGERMATAGLVKSLEDTQADAQAALAEARAQGQELAQLKADTEQSAADANAAAVQATTLIGNRVGFDLGPNEAGFVEVETDRDGYVLRGTLADGSAYDGATHTVASVFEEDAEGWATVDTDMDGWIISGVRLDGSVYPSAAPASGAVTTADGSLIYSQTLGGVTRTRITAADGTDQYVGLPNSMFDADWYYLPSTGQSLSAGVDGEPALSAADDPYGNLTWPDGPLPHWENAQPNPDLSRLVPLYSKNRETHMTAIGRVIGRTVAEGIHPGAFGGRRHTLVIASHGIGASVYSEIKKGGTKPAYAQGLAQLDALMTIARAQGKTVRVPYLILIHGETDDERGTANYLQNLVEMQRDYQADYAARTGQSSPIPMLLSQTAWRITGLVVQAQYDVCVQRPDTHILIGPKYHLPHATSSNGQIIHLSNTGYRQHGEEIARVYRQLMAGRAWKPLMPRRLYASGPRTITAQFHVPVPPLRWDTQTVTNPGNYGFAARDDSGALNVSGVQLSGPDTVTLTVDRDLAANPRLTYACNPVGKSPQGVAADGPLYGPRGNLCDSDKTPSLFGNDLKNWAVHFDLPLGV